MSRRVACLLVLGLCQMAAELVGLPGVRALAAASVASPAPRVFTKLGELEPYSMTFAVRTTGADGAPRRVVITPDVYAQLRGPYNRRNAYGAAMAAGPWLAAQPMTRAMLAQTLQHGLCDDAPLLRELGIAVRPGDPALALEYVARGRGLTTPPPVAVRCP